MPTFAVRPRSSVFTSATEYAPSGAATMNWRDRHGADVYVTGKNGARDSVMSLKDVDDAREEGGRVLNQLKIGTERNATRRIASDGSLRCAGIELVCDRVAVRTLFSTKLRFTYSKLTRNSIPT